jgi:hypothetical protein
MGCPCGPRVRPDPVPGPGMVVTALIAGTFVYTVPLMPAPSRRCERRGSIRTKCSMRTGTVGPKRIRCSHPDSQRASPTLSWHVKRASDGRARFPLWSRHAPMHHVWQRSIHGQQPVGCYPREERSLWGPFHGQQRVGTGRREERWPAFLLTNPGVTQYVGRLPLAVQSGNSQA